ncbi:MAG: alpha/beta hydrolase [Lachnospiraceae bacterium]|nr:alpha/beta hydrolase [Lachnospiraceae bacterium]
MPSIQANMLNALFRVIGRDTDPNHDYQAEREQSARSPVPKLPKNVVFEEISLNGISAEKLTKPGNTKGWIFYIHGGGFTTGSAKERRMLCQYLVDKFGYNCISTNYRLAPENKWPAMIEDCFTAYCALEEMGIAAEEVVFAGESAGGTLVLSLGLMLKEKGMKQPKAILSFSPCVNQAEHYPSHFRNAKTDYMMKDAIAKGISDPVFGENATDEEKKNPLASPIYGNFKGVAPIFISASDSEALLDDSLMLYAKLVKVRHKTELDLAHDVCHAYPMITMMPEAQKTLKKAIAFAEKYD